MTPVELAAAAVVAEWRAHPHAVIRTGLREAITKLGQALDADGAARQLELAFTPRTLDHEAWARVLGHPEAAWTGTAGDEA